MSGVKWIKLNTHIFEDEKIRLIEQMPDGDTILIIWIKLLSQAGKTNASGYIFLNERIPYTEEMLAAIFNRPLNTVRLALQTFREFGMIDIDDQDFICITNWEKHQNVDGLDKIREDTRKRVQRHRDKQKQLQLCNATRNVTVTVGNETEEEREEEREEEKEREKEDTVEIINYLNQAADKNFQISTKKTKTLISARLKEGFTVSDFKRVIDNKASQWKGDPKMDKFLRPTTLFAGNFESYLNEKQMEREGSHGSPQPDYEGYDFEQTKGFSF